MSFSFSLDPELEIKSTVTVPDPYGLRWSATVRNPAGSAAFMSDVVSVIVDNKFVRDQLLSQIQEEMTKGDGAEGMTRDELRGTLLLAFRQIGLDGWLELLRLLGRDVIKCIGDHLIVSIDGVKGDDGPIDSCQELIGQIIDSERLIRMPDDVAKEYFGSTAKAYTLGEAVAWWVASVALSEKTFTDKYRGALGKKSRKSSTSGSRSGRTSQKPTKRSSRRKSPAAKK